MCAALFGLRKGFRFPNNIWKVHRRSFAHAALGCLFVCVVLNPERINASPIERVDSITNCVNVGIIQRTFVNEKGSINRDRFIIKYIQPILFGEWFFKPTGGITGSGQTRRDCVLGQPQLAGIHKRVVGKFASLQIASNIYSPEYPRDPTHIGYTELQRGCWEGFKWPIPGYWTVNFLPEQRDKGAPELLWSQQIVLLLQPPVWWP